MKKLGFTLVELSIVLVIIGLLIGGILVGQSLISSAKNNKTIQQLSGLTIAVNSFQQKYKQLPGDSMLFPTSLGNRNGIIGEGTHGAAAFWDEAGQAWYELSLGMGLKNANGQNFTPYSILTNVNNSKNYFPQLAIDQPKLSSPHAVTLNLGYYTNIKQHGFYFRTASGGTYPQIGNGRSYGAANSRNLAALDNKMDDGVANTGSIASTSEGTTNTTLCETSGVYNTNSDEYNCCTYIGMSSWGEKK